MYSTGQHFLPGPLKFRNSALYRIVLHGPACALNVQEIHKFPQAESTGNAAFSTVFLEAQAYM